MYSRIIGTGSALPEKSLTNEEFALLLAKDGIETSDEWIRTRTGIVTRYFADPEKGECTTSLAVEAAKNALGRFDRPHHRRDDDPRHDLPVDRRARAGGSRRSGLRRL